MWLSWVWADRRLVLANSPLLFEKSISDLSQVLSEITQQIEKYREALSASYREHIESEVAFESLFKRNKNFLIAENEYIQKISELDQSIVELVSRVGGTRNKDENDIGVALIRSQINGIVYDLRNISNQKEKRLQDIRKRNKNTQLMIDEHSEKFSRQLSIFNEISYDLVGFHQNIGISERLRIFILDYIPVNAIFLLAMGSSAICGIFLADASFGSK